MTRSGHRVSATTALALTAIALVSAGLAPSAASGQVRVTPRTPVDDWLDEQLPSIVAFYRETHRFPELSLQEEKTAARVAARFEAAGFETTTGVGGHGVVALLENGTGPTVLIRGDTDALPVKEDTDLAWASRVEGVDHLGQQVSVMHACGHDVHTANLVAVAEFLAAHRERWSGRLMLVAQPAEEIGRGALMMMEDGLFERFGKPDYTLALHVESGLPAGRVGLIPGWAGANVDAVKITIFGRGGHGARPHLGVDPITTAAYLITQLQTLVSRRVPPQEPAVVSVGSIHGGHKYNVIPDEVELQVTMRSYSDETRAILVDGIRQMTRDVCITWQCPKPPVVDVREHYTPALYNDPELTERARGVFERVLGSEQVVDREPSMGGDDFGRYSRVLGVPSLLYRLGAADPERHRASLDGGEALPPLHSSRFAPDAERSLATALRTMTALVEELLPPRAD